MRYADEVWMFIVMMALVFAARCSNADQYTDARNAGLRAAYEQLGWKSNIDEFGKCMKNRYIDKETEKWWATFFFITNSISQQGVQVKWTF